MENRAATLCVLAYLFITLALGSIIMNQFEIYVNKGDVFDRNQPSDFNITKNAVIAAIGIPFGIFLFFKGFSWMKTKKLMENMPTSKIRSLAMGLVEIYGRAIPAKGHLIKGPHSDRECIYYKYVIEESTSGKDDARWKKVEKGEGRAYFFVDDGTGYVLVDPKEADIEAPSDSDDGKFFGFESYSERTGSFGRKVHIRYKEFNILPGENVYVMGKADKNPLRKVASTNHTANIIIKKDINEKIFYISKTHEKDIIKGLNMFSIGAIVASFIMIVGSIIINMFPFY